MWAVQQENTCICMYVCMWVSVSSLDEYTHFVYKRVGSCVQLTHVQMRMAVARPWHGKSAKRKPEMCKKSWEKQDNKNGRVMTEIQLAKRMLMLQRCRGDTWDVDHVFPPSQQMIEGFCTQLEGFPWFSGLYRYLTESWKNINSGNMQKRYAWHPAACP